MRTPGRSAILSESARRDQRRGDSPDYGLMLNEDLVLGGAPESWYGVAAPCPTCGRDVNVFATKPVSGTGPARKR